MGEHLMRVPVLDGYRLWAPVYDRDPNPILALEMRILRDRLGFLEGKVFLDAGAGTGRWMKQAHAAGARTFGVDLSPEMLALASGSLVRGDIRRLPFADSSVDIAMCSMTAGYIPCFNDLLAELTRVARQVIVTDLHPAAAQAGWTRSFRSDGTKYELEHHCHFVRDLQPDWFLEACFGEPERHVFEAAGKLHAFEKTRHVPAIYAACWTRAVT
jgi:SAM-dependent methyltransferase